LIIDIRRPDGIARATPNTYSRESTDYSGAALVTYGGAGGLEVPLNQSSSVRLVEEPPKRAGLGTLMQSVKKDVQVPEFDMSAIF
jgi:hypothetical protein